MEISLICCIDFTGSNGDPRNPNSLHYMKPFVRGTQDLNDYQKAILSVGEILLNYDADKLVQTYGFGAKPRGSQQTSHFFPCSGDYTNCSGVGVNGVFELYKLALNNVTLSGPTFFAPMLKEIRLFTEDNFKRSPDNYTILLILTDGVIHDMQRSIDEVVRASCLPLSVIIVGIGDADFDLMEQLDSDDKVTRQLKCEDSCQYQISKIF